MKASTYPLQSGADVAAAQSTDPGLSSSPLPRPTVSNRRLAGKRVGMVMFSTYPADPRPRRAADALVKSGASVELICLRDEKSPKREFLNGVDVRRVAIEQRRAGKLAYAYQYSAFILISAAILALRSLRRRYDLVYVHNMPDILVVSALIPKLFGAKVVLDLHDPMPELMTTIFGHGQDSRSVRLIKWLEKWSIARANLVLTVNVACKRIFGSRSCSPGKIGVVMNSPAEEIFPFRAARSYASANQNPTKRFVIMYHGSLVERNGVDLAVEALAGVRETIPGVELRIYGPKTAFLERVMEEVHSRNLHGNVRYLGAKRLEDLVHEIEDCDVGVVPNQRNAFTDINTPTRIFEYLALGKPVIAPGTPGIQDYFGPESLFFFESGNSEQLAEKFKYVSLHRDEALQVAERGQQVYLAHTWSQEKQHLINLISELFDC